ncbi:MAG: acetyl-CoA carboxylase carboxyl transferase subunit beta, partial [Candidatus Eremiobacteraeota bacterium]|nr:acetyl-CoA carboxylase carboxyl transferase subunit beta [Candidatus Eremiobacteraeota bacterium]
MKRKTGTGENQQRIACPGCQVEFTAKELAKNRMVCPSCNYHNHMPAKERVKLLVDPRTFTEWKKNLTSVDPLNFRDRKNYM